MPVRKRFGQNFLRDRNTVERITAAVAPKQEDHIIEIGPGHGALTEYLVRSGCRLTVIEVDFDLADELRVKYGKAVHIFEADVLKFDFEAISGRRPWRIVGNLPYNISTPLLFRLFERIDDIEDMHLMLQLEVVDRMVAKPSTAEYGRLSVMCQYYCETTRLFNVPPSAFTPRPKVTSSVVRLIPRDSTMRCANDVKILETLLARAFSQRRKTIKNAMKSFLSPDDLTALSLDPRLRPENLSPAQYVECANYIARRGRVS